MKDYDNWISSSLAAPELEHSYTLWYLISEFLTAVRDKTVPQSPNLFLFFFFLFCNQCSSHAVIQGPDEDFQPGLTASLTLESQPFHFELWNFKQTNTLICKMQMIKVILISQN